MSDLKPSTDLVTKAPNPLDLVGSKTKRESAASRKEVVSDPATQDAVAKVLNGEMGVEDAQKKFPDIIPILQGTVGNDMVEVLLKGGAHKKGKPEEKKDEASKEGAAKKEAKAPPADPQAEAESKMTALVLGIVGAKMGLAHLLKDKDAKEAADPTKKEAEAKKTEAAEKKDAGADKKDPGKTVEDAKKAGGPGEPSEKDKKDTGAAAESKDQASKVADQAKEGGAEAKTPAAPAPKKKRRRRKLRRKMRRVVPRKARKLFRRKKRKARKARKGKGGGAAPTPEPEAKDPTPPQEPPPAKEPEEAKDDAKEDAGGGEGPAAPGAEKKEPGGGGGGPAEKEEAAEKKEPEEAAEKEDPGADKKDEGGGDNEEAAEKKEEGAEKKEPGAEQKEQGPGGGGAEKKEPGAEKKEEGPGAEKKEPGAEQKEQGPGGGGGGNSDVQDPAPQPVVPPPQMTGPGGTLDSYMANNPDPAARERVTNHGHVTDKLERSSKELGGKVELAPDKAWYDAVTPRQEWFAFKQKINNNPWSGQDKVMAFMHNFNAGLDLVSSAVSKVGLAATIGGVILTFLVPPVGAFLLTVGRVCNAISVVLSGLKLIVSIVQTIMLAVKAAKEKDPLKRMEMMQQMKSSLQSGVMAGIDLILSKVGGGAKGAAGSAGSKAMDAAKTAFKEAKDAGKGMVKAGMAGLKAGAGTFVKGMGTAMKEGAKGMKNSVKDGFTGLKNAIKSDGVIGTMKNGLVSAGKSMKEAVVKPFSDIKTAFGGFSSVKKSWNQFATGVGKNGYFKTVGQMNFKNAMGAKSFTDKLKGAYKDVTDKSAGGAATQIDMFMNGKSDKNKGKNNKQETENHAREAKAKQKELEAAMGGNVTQQRQYLAKQQEKQYKDLRHLDDDTIKHMMKAKQKELAKSMSFGPKTPGLSQGLSIASGLKGLATGDMSVGDAVKTGLESSQSDAMGTAAKFMVNNKSVGDVKGEKKSLLAEAAETNEARSKKAIEGVQAQLQKQARGGLTEAKCKSAMTPAFGVISKREAELQGLMAQSGQKPAGPATESAPEAAAVQGPPPPPPPPPAPPEGTVVPEESLLADIKGQRDRLSGIKSSVQGSIKRAEDQKQQAIKGDATLQQYAAGLDKQKAEVTQQEAEAQKDQAEITASKAKIAEGGKQVSEKKGVADGEKGKASSTASQGGAVQVVPDKAKQQAEEKKRAAEEKAKEEAEWKKAGLLKKAYLGAKKFVKTIGDFMASAAKWVWEKMIAPAIAKVKQAVASVMNAITNLLMSGIIKIIGAIMGKEAENNLNQTFADMKKMEADQAKAATTETKGKNEEAKLKLTKAQQAAKEKVDTCQANIAEGTQLLGEIDAQDAALQAEEQKIVADREAFRAQYSPYFDWVKIYEEWQAKNGAAEEGKKPQPGGGGGEKTPGGSGAANEGPSGGEQEHPADRPLESTVGLALSSAAEVVKVESQESQSAVAKAAKEKADAVKSAARGAYDQNMADLKAASDKDKTKDMSQAYGVENDRVTQAGGNADQVVAAVTGQHGKAEADRRGRIDALIARARSLSGKKANEGLQEAKEIWRLISEEAKGIEPAQEQALQDLAAGFDKMKAG